MLDKPPPRQLNDPCRIHRSALALSLHLFLTIHLSFLTHIPILYEKRKQNHHTPVGFPSSTKIWQR